MSFPRIIPAQEGFPSSEIPVPPQFQELIKSGELTPRQVWEWIKAMEEGQVSPGMIDQLREEGKLGTLTPDEIKAGKRLLEQKKKAEKNAEEKTGIEPEKEKPLEPDEEFFKKDPGPGRPSPEIFGHKLFSSAPSTFAPIKTVPVSNGYIVGPGDEIKILMWGRLDVTYSLEVDNEGIINFPKIGPLTVAGLTFGELKELIKRKVESITGVNVNVSMGKLRTIQIFVLGEAKSPGLYTVNSLATTANALLSSGGPTPLGSLRRVELKRQAKIITTIDFYDFLLKGDISADTRLMPGDVIFVPQAGPMVTVSGNVKRSATYELKDNRTLSNAINLAGGLKPRAYNQRIQIERAFENQKEIVLDISYEELQKKKPISLQDGDLIRVFSILPSAVNAVFLYGNVLRPGQYAYKQGLRVLDILPDLESLDTDTYFDYALVKRYRLEDMEAELIPFDIGRLFLSKDRAQNIPLMPLDEVYIFNKQMFEDREYAAVEGEVRKPGRYSVDEKMRLKDLLFKAGGLTRDAYLDLGHLFRTDRRTKEVTIHTFDVERAMAGDLQDNLRMEDLDRVVIHSIWDYREEYTVSIKGMVHNPGEYPYVTDMTIKDLIMVAGNVSDAAYMERAELVRYDIVYGKEVQTSVLSFDVGLALEDDPSHNLKLQALDVVHIKEIPEWWDKKKTVAISGEVYFPGTYQIRRDERLSDVIERAGGYKETAYLRGALFTRESIRRIQQGRLDDMLKKLEIEIAVFSSQEAQSALSREDIAAQTQFVSAQKALVAKLRETKASGRVVISLLPMSILRGSSSDLVLEDGDTLKIPPKTDTVNILGCVYNPVALIYEKDKPKLKHYLNKTGGPTDDAEKDQMYIIRADGTIVSKNGTSWSGISWNNEESRWGFWGRFENTPLYPGDTVQVPQKVVQPRFMRDVKDITELIYRIAVVVGMVAVAAI